LNQHADNLAGNIRNPNFAGRNDPRKICQHGAGGLPIVRYNMKKAGFDTTGYCLRITGKGWPHEQVSFGLEGYSLGI